MIYCILQAYSYTRGNLRCAVIICRLRRARSIQTTRRRASSRNFRGQRLRVCPPPRRNLLRSHLRAFKKALIWDRWFRPPKRQGNLRRLGRLKHGEEERSEATLSSLHSDPPVPPENSQFSLRKDSLKSQTCQDLGSRHDSAPAEPPEPSERMPEDVSFFLSAEDDCFVPASTDAGPEAPPAREFPEGFEPVRSEHLAEMRVPSSPIVRNPYMSPLLAPDSMLRGLPPVHIVACALDPMLDDSVMFAKRLRNVDQPVTLCVVEDLPHGFLSLSQLSRETREAANVCVERIREVFTQQGPPAATRKHRKLERTNQGSLAARPLAGTIQEEEPSPGGGVSTMEGEESPEGAGQNNSDSREIGA
ncbi:hypothetical protein SKAU_G00075520 [Synaphobranchus kaupii]|uniref:Alpha/beta hydrolase fold-3 domain-containing protein n=1 Tax=Synaphobranchus kaupii TaxID=118154 RepID=A0A9Q1G7L7_SYNKA|nr:hypothetical protein SKAU_G00075520 [Synaphobranchus kaupii]